MPRLTLGDQVANQMRTIERLQEEAGKAQQTITDQRAAIESQNAQLMQLRRDLIIADAAKGELADTKKKLESSLSLQNHYSAEAATLRSEIEQAHAVLDSVEGAPAREYKGEYGDRQRNVVTRLAGAFLTIAQRSQRV